MHNKINILFVKLDYFSEILILFLYSEFAGQNLKLIVLITELRIKHINSIELTTENVLQNLWKKSRKNLL